MNSICPHFSSILFCLQLVCRMFKHKLLKAVAVLQLIERVLVLRVLFPPISPKTYRLLTISYFILLVLLFFDREPHGPKNMPICLFFATWFWSSFFFHVKEKRKILKLMTEFVFLKEPLNLKFAVMNFFLYCIAHHDEYHHLTLQKKSALHQKMKK